VREGLAGWGGRTSKLRISESQTRDLHLKGVRQTVQIPFGHDEVQ
jgi:hypothetical protein